MRGSIDRLAGDRLFVGSRRRGTTFRFDGMLRTEFAKALCQTQTYTPAAKLKTDCVRGCNTKAPGLSFYGQVCKCK